MRFIPAGAGNTKLDITECSRVAVYPRWRGEHLRARGDSARAYGLSPLARGTLQVGAHQNHLIRFIPAGAGNTLPYFFIVHVHAVYPRWRGEHFSGSFLESDQGGLSPLARGTRAV